MFQVFGFLQGQEGELLQADQDQRPVDQQGKDFVGVQLERLKLAKNTELASLLEELVCGSIWSSS